MARRPLLWPLVPLYAAALRLKGDGPASPRRLGFPVVSVGGISAGGSGKTPMVMLLVELLRERGCVPVVLSRGYRRTGSGVERVLVDGDASRYGDEPMLMARAGGAVYVGADRYAAGVMASESADARTVFVLDDGFQHRGLARDVDVVLVTARDTEDALLPAGDLREPLRALKRADLVVLREEEAAALLPRLRQWTGAPVWVVRRRLSFVGAMPTRAFAFCGIARPEGFVEMLRAAGVGLVGTMFFGDHHAFSEGDVVRLIATAKKAGAECLVTTEKDHVRLSAAMLARLEAALPVRVAKLALELVDEDVAMTELLTRLVPVAGTGAGA